MHPHLAVTLALMNETQRDLDRRARRNRRPVRPAGEPATGEFRPPGHGRRRTAAPASGP